MAPQRTPSFFPTNPVEDYAVLTLKMWRHAGHTNLEILNTLTAPNPDADAQWEKDQQRRVGIVYAPPLEVKARIRQLVSADATAAA